MNSNLIIGIVAFLVVAGFFYLFASHNHFFASEQAQNSAAPPANSALSVAANSLNNDYLDDSLAELNSLEQAQK